MQVIFNVFIFFIGVIIAFLLLYRAFYWIKQGNKIKKGLKMKNKKVNKTSAAKLRSNAKYQAKHKTEVYRNQKKSRAKNFILNDARIDELNYFSELINKRKKELKK